MLHDQCIVCFAPDPWQDLWRNRHRLLSIFARSNRILYVEPRTRIRHLASGLRKGRIRPRHLFRRRVEEVRPNLFVYHDPLFLPRIQGRGIGPWVDRVRTSSLRRAMRRVGIDRPVLWLVRPDCHDLPGQFRESAVLYQVVDDYLAYPGVSDSARIRLDREERKLAGLADLVVVTSDHLLDVKRHLHENMLVVRNGVDERTLEEGKRGSGTVPKDLVGARRPILGYIGGITEKLDLELLEKVANAGIGTLALVGSVNVYGADARERLTRLEASPHVIFTGRKDASLVPDYVRAFDVCLVPYRLGNQARAIDPLKLYEYLAFGKPTVSVAIPSVERFRDVLTIAHDPDEFVRRVAEATQDSDPALAERRRQVARENSWEHRAEVISEALEAVLRAKPHGGVGPR
jgi:glycosyltransferase involved in cell wall biosynthesis